MGQDYSDDERGDGFANRVGGLHQAQSFAAMLGTPCLGDEGGRCGPFASHPEAENEAKHGKLHDRM